MHHNRLSDFHLQPLNAMAAYHVIGHLPWPRRPLYSLETTWYKDDTPIGRAGVAYSFDDLWNRTLSLLAVGEQHSGVYSCRARLRSANFPEVTAEASVTVLGEWRFESRRGRDF